MGFTQGVTPIICDNKCAMGIAKTLAKMRRSRAMDMRWHWIRDRNRQEFFSGTAAGTI
jgi:hypothetical protein